MTKLTIGYTLLLSAALAGCGGGGAPAPAPKPTVFPSASAAPTPRAAAPAAAPAPAPAANPASLVPAAPEVPAATATYEARGRKDPFEPLEQRSGASGAVVASTRLTGIVRNPTASLALIETPDGLGYILKPGDTLFDGRLVQIGVDSVVFSVAAKPGSNPNTVVLKLAAN